MTNRSKVAGFLSLIGTPVLLLVMPSITAYLASQRDLNYQIDVLLPFITLAAVVLASGVLIWVLPRNTENDAGYKLRLWLYYLAGPAFLCLTLLREFPITMFERLPGVILAVVVYVVGAIVAARRIRIQKAVNFFAVLSAAFLMVESFRFFSGIEQTEVTEAGVLRAPALADRNETLPNIYHLILDGFHSDIFSLLLTDKVKSELDGFTWFEEASSEYDRTAWSVPSVFLGKYYDLSTSQQRFQTDAFNSTDSLLHQLKDVGYLSIAFTREMYHFDYDLFDETVLHVNNIEIQLPDNSDSFKRLWVYRNLPLVVSSAMSKRGWLISEEDMRNFGANTFLSETLPLKSRLSFASYLQQEEALPSNARYTFVHLILPHDPFVLDADCSQKRSTDVMLQSQCAVRLVVEFASLLKRLDRYDSSMILVHSDHGERFSVDGTQLDEIEHRSHRSLLMIKPPGGEPRQPFKVSSAEAALLDVAPTLYEFVGRSSAEHTGVSLLDSSNEEVADRERFYNIAVDESHFRRYSIDGRNLIFVEEVEYPNSDASGSTGRRDGE